MKLNIPDMKSNSSARGEHGPDKVVKSDLPLVRNHDHVHTINPINHVTGASAFGFGHGKK